MKKTTESESNYNGLEEMKVIDLLININKEDQLVANFVKEQLHQIEKLVNIVIEERKEVLEKRDYKVFDFLNNNPLKINTKSIW